MLASSSTFNTQHFTLPSRGVVLVSGADAASFLQGLVTNHIGKASGREAVFAALLTPQGKFLHDFFILKAGDSFLLEMDKERIPDLMKRLNLYKLRSQVVVEDMSVRYAIVAGQPQQNTIVSYSDPRHPALGMRMLLPAKQAKDMPDGEVEYNAQRLALGIPEGNRDLIAEQHFPMQFGYDALNAIDFGKGCYIGQEVTARSKHRGTLRKYVHQVLSDGTALPPAGTPVLADGKEVGEMRSSQGNTGLALLKLEDAAGNLTAGEIPVKAQLPDWLSGKTSNRS